jgi:hypothetical protein
VCSFEEIPLNLEEMYTALLGRFHAAARPSANGWRHSEIPMGSRQPAEERGEQP